MPGSNNGTGWPLTVRCAKCKVGRDFRRVNKTGLHTYYRAGAAAHRGRVYVCYVAYQGASPLTKADAIKYLAWLDAGGVGRHYKVLDGHD